MKQERILDALNGVDTAYILDAAPDRQTPQRSRLGIWMGLAACLAVAALSVFGLMLHTGAPDTRTEQPASSLSDATEPQAPTDTRASDFDDKAGVAQDSETPIDEQTNTDRETVLAYRIGDLYLGMPQAELEALLGEPLDQTKDNIVTYEDGISRTTWFYNLSGEPYSIYDLSINLADAGDGWVVNKIMVWANVGLTLPHEIRIGMTEEELLAAWPTIRSDCTLRREGYEPETESLPFACYDQHAGDGLRLEVDLMTDAVFLVSLGTYYPDPQFVPDNGATMFDESYSFVSGEITVWRFTGGEEEGRWQRTELTAQQAKQVETQFTIEELLPLEQTDCKSVRRYLVDFHNGTVAVVLCEKEHGTVYLLQDREALEWGLANGSMYPELLGLTAPKLCTFPQGAWALLEELTE